MRHSWSHSASVLLQREEDLKLIRVCYQLYRDYVTPNLVQERLNSVDRAITSKYASLETERLVALANSKFQDLFQNLWHSQEGCRALEFLVQLAGLKPLETTSSQHPPKTESASHTMELKVGIKPIRFALYSNLPNTRSRLQRLHHLFQ